MLSSFKLKKGDFVYYARAVGYDCLPLVVYNVNEEFQYFTAIDRNKRNKTGVTYLFDFSDYGKTVFDDMVEAKDYLERIIDQRPDNK